MLDAVSTTLGYETDRAPLDFPEHVLQGLLDMFPMVQTLPKDRLIWIQIPVDERLASGMSTLVVWAHHVLDLTVLVQRRRTNGQMTNSLRFGRSNFEQVIIEEVSADEEGSITLLDSQREHLLTIRPERDAESALIGSVRRRAARGWGNALIVDHIDGFLVFKKRSKAVIEDLQIVTSAFAFIVAKHLVKDDTERDKFDVTPTIRDLVVYRVDEQRLIQASRFLFDNACISRGEIDRLVAQYSFKALDQNPPLPPALDAASRVEVANRDRILEDEWNIICGHAKRLSILLLALANVIDLDDCEDLMFTDFAFGSMFEHILAQQLDEWNGREPLRIPGDAWLQALAVPLLGHKSHIWKTLPWDKVCLISDGRWSAWISTFGDMDPGYTNAGSVRLGRGSPCRNGIWKTGIWDCSHRIFSHGSFSFMTNPRGAESCGQSTSLRCSEKVTFDSPYCGEGDDVFVVCARLRLHKAVQNQGSVVRIGYKELETYLWWAQISKHCFHGSRIRDDIKLAVGCATVAGFGNYLEDIDERIIIYHTAHSPGARWLALATIPCTSLTGDVEPEDKGSRQILLRGNECCFQCTIDRAASKSGKWYIIL